MSSHDAPSLCPQCRAGVVRRVYGFWCPRCRGWVVLYRSTRYDIDGSPMVWGIRGES